MKFQYKNYKIILTLAIILILSGQCSSDKLKIISSETGSNLSGGGSISDLNLIYRFKKYSRGGAVKDLFNYLYFNGDTLCFSFKFNKKVNIAKNKIHIWFENPVSRDLFPVERIDLLDKRISGFSLVGSIMESFFREKLKDPVPPDAFCCRDIPFKIKIEIEEEKGKINSEINGAFRIEYR